MSRFSSLKKRLLTVILCTAVVTTGTIVTIYK